MLMFMQETCDHLIKGVEKYADKSDAFELKSVFGKYSMDTIALCAFGVDAESFTSEKSTFVEYANNIMTFGTADGIKFATALIPGGLNILKMFDLSVMKKTETEFFYHAVMSSLNNRRESKRRNDLIDLMLDAIKGEVDHDTEELNQFEKVNLIAFI